MDVTQRRRLQRPEFGGLIRTGPTLFAKWDKCAGVPRVFALRYGVNLWSDTKQKRYMAVALVEQEMRYLTLLFLFFPLFEMPATSSGLIKAQT